MLNLRKKILIQAIVLACILGVLATFLVLFKQNIEHQLTTLNGLKSRKELFSRSATGLVELKKEWETAKQYEPALAEFAPTREDLVGIIQQVKQIGQNHGVTVTFAYGPEVEGFQSKAIQFTASADGSLTGISAFLREFDSSFNTAQVDTLDITQKSQGVHVSMIGKVRYRE
jgi:Tfp pilus assembly protein PilO